MTDWASCGQYSSGCRRRRGLADPGNAADPRATASVMVCQRAGGPPWARCPHGLPVPWCATSAPVPSTMASPSSAVHQCMPMYSAISRALVLASAPSLVALSGGRLVGFREVGARTMPSAKQRPGWSSTTATRRQLTHSRSAHQPRHPQHGGQKQHQQLRYQSRPSCPRMMKNVAMASRAALGNMGELEQGGQDPQVLPCAGAGGVAAAQSIGPRNSLQCPAFFGLRPSGPWLGPQRCIWHQNGGRGRRCHFRVVAAGSADPGFRGAAAVRFSRSRSGPAPDCAAQQIARDVECA